MFRSVSLKNICIALAPAVLLPAITYFRFNYFSAYEPLIAEDGLFEMLQFTFYFLASYLYIQAFRVALAKKQLLWSSATGLAAVVFFLVALEEISWGQRIFNLHNPDYFQEHNIQYEISFHNLDTVQPFLHWAYLIAGLLLSFSNTIISALYKGKNMFITVCKEQLPSTLLSFYFLPLSALYAILMFYKPFGIIMKNGVPFMLGRDQELVETFLTLGLALNAWRMYTYCRKTLRVQKKNEKTIRYFLPSFLVR